MLPPIDARLAPRLFDPQIALLRPHGQVRPTAAGEEEALPRDLGAGGFDRGCEAQTIGYPVPGGETQDP
jgi:hypothetical protein